MPFQTHETIRNHNPIGLPTQDDVSLRHSVHLPSRWKLVMTGEKEDEKCHIFQLDWRLSERQAGSQPSSQRMSPPAPVLLIDPFS